VSEIYRIGVAIMLTQNGVAPALSLISRQLLGVHRSVAQIGTGFNSWRLGLVGVAGVMAGSGIIGGLMKIADHGKELLNQQDKLIRAGRTHAEVTNLTADAYSRITKLVPTASGSDVLRSIGELTMVLGDAKHAAAAAPYSLKLEALLSNATGRKSEGEGYNFWRAVELKGGTQLPEAQRDSMMGAMAAGTIASQGKFGGREWFTLAKRMGTSWLNMDPAMMGILPTLGLGMGADTAGTAMMTATQTILGATTLRKQQLAAFESAGLIDNSKVTHDAGGRVNVGMGGIRGSDQYGNNLWQWTEKVLMPAMIEKGFTDPKIQAALFAKMFPNRNANRIFSEFSNPLTHAQFVKDLAIQGQALPLNQAYGEYSKNNPRGVEAAYEAQKKSMLEAIGAPLMQAALPIMSGVTTMFNHIGAFANAHPTAIKIIGEGFAAIGIALMAAGGAAILAAFGATGWLVGGLVALGGALSVVVANWNSFVGMFTKFAGLFGFSSAYAGTGMTPGPNDSPGGAAFDRPHTGRHSIVPPPPAYGPQQQSWNLSVDGEKIAAVTTNYLVAGAGRSQGSQGSAYFDPTMAGMPLDISRAYT
jgi:hypothetical protein